MGDVAALAASFATSGRFYVTYSNQIAEQRGNIIGGFTCSHPSDPACDLGPDYTPVDHDQRHTLNTGFTANLPLHTWFASNVYYGSGFTNGLAGAETGPYNGDLSARAHHFRCLGWTPLRRELELSRHGRQRHRTIACCWTTPSPSADFTTTTRA